MPAYVALFRWTDDGVRAVKDTVNRARESVAAIEKAGGKVTVYWTQGRYDLVAFLNAPNEETAMSIGLSSGKAGKLRSETLRAYTMEEMERILKNVS